MSAAALQTDPAGAAPDADPAREYALRMAAREARAQQLRRRTGRLAQARLAAFALVVAALLGAWITRAFSAGLALAPLLVFVVLVVLHQRSRAALERAERAEQFYRGGLARLAYKPGGERWTQLDFIPPEHPYAEHLDLFGPASLFARLCHAQTRGGAERLASWLLAPAELPALRERHEAARELRERLALREDRAVAAPLRAGGLAADWLVAWGRQAPPAPSAALRAAVFAVSVAAGLALLWAFWGGGWSAFLVVALGLELPLYLSQRARTRRVSQALSRPARELEQLGELLARFEREPFAAPRLQELRARSSRSGRPPSAQIARLRRLGELLELQRNQLFAPLGAALLWGTQVSLAIEAWCAAHGPELGAWLDVLFELEALLDLGGYAYEHPADPFPELVGEGGPLLEARELGHPLLSPERCVRNSLALGPQRALYVVSGSNMSGKSTWLRAIGSNAVLALAGAPVRAEQLRISPLWVGASIRVQDSLEEGISRFYAEIRGLARVAALAEERPLLFLLDEILAGTNSHDRGIGAAALVRAFLDKGAIGLLTTHDLALARIAEELAPRAANVHFEDHVEDGQVRFDYRMREGVVARSNALALMRAVGLRV